MSNFQTMWPMGFFNKDDFFYRNAKRLPMSPTFTGSLLQPMLSLILFLPKLALISLALVNYPYLYPLTMVAEFCCIVLFNKTIYGQFHCKFSYFWYFITEILSASSSCSNFYIFVFFVVLQDFPSICVFLRLSALFYTFSFNLRNFMPFRVILHSFALFYHDLRF